MKVTRPLLSQIKKTINFDPRYKGYRKEIAERIDLDETSEKSFNCLSFEDHDLSDLYQIDELLNEDIEETKNGIKLDVFLYRKYELENYCYVYIRKIKDNIYFMSLEPIEDGQLITEAVRALKTK